MDTIKMYINNLFQNLPESDEVVRAKEDLLGMMEDKYNELKAQGKSENEAIGIVISEFGNIDELKEELGLNKKTADAAHNGEEENSEKFRMITFEEAKNFIEDTVKFGFKMAIGVVLCILSVVPLIVLAGFAEGKNELGIDVLTGLEETQHFSVVTDKIAVGVGLSLMFVFIAVAVAIFIINGLRYEKYNYIKKDKFVLDKAALSYVSDLKESYRNKFAMSITIGVVLCIMSVVPVVFVGYMFENEGEQYAIVAVAVLFLLIATAVFLFMRAGILMDSYKQLLQEEEYAPRNKNNQDFSEKVASIYWPLATAIYLGWSFISMDWGRTWIVWPIAGVLFGAIVGIGSAFSTEKKER